MPRSSLKEPGIYRLNDFAPQVSLAYSGREFPRASFKTFLEQLKIPAESLRLAKQVHGNSILTLTENAPILHPPEADGWISDLSQIALGILTADCIPIFAASQDGRVIGIVHAGWRGVKAGIIENWVQKFRDDYRVPASEMRIAFGPAIRACCYEVGAEFDGYFPKSFRKDPSRNSKGKMDLPGEVVNRLESHGIRSSQIRDAKICTVCENRLFFSARKEGTPERILSVIMKNDI